MRLFYIDPHPVPDEVPEALQILQTVDALAAVGVDVTLVTTAPRSGVTIADILGRPPHPALKVVYEPQWRQRWPVLKRSARLFNRWVMNWLKDQGADAVYVRSLKLADALLATPGQPPVFFESHELFSRTYADEHRTPTWRERRKLAALDARERRVYGKAAGVVALTSLLLDDIRAAYGFKGAGAVAPDGVDLELARRAPPPVKPNPVPVLLYLGSLHVWKGVETAIAALPAIPDAILRIAGGPASRIAELAAQAEQLGVAGRVEFLGAVHPGRRFEIIAGADACLLPLGNYTIGQRHTSPLKLFEYLAMGKPVIAANSPALREVVQHEESALLFQTEQAAALAAAANRLLQDKELQRRLARNGLALAQGYSWQARAQVIREFVGNNLALG